MDRCEYIELRMEEVVNDIQMESATKVVDDNIIREQPYEPEDMVVEDNVMPIPCPYLGFVALKRATTTPVTLEEMPLKVLKIEIEVGEPSASSQRWNSKHVPIDVIVIDSNSDDDALVAIMESRSSGAAIEMEMKPTIQTQVETYLEARGCLAGEISCECQLRRELQVHMKQEVAHALEVERHNAIINK